MFRLITVAAILTLAAPAAAFAQDPHGAHAGHQPSGHTGMDHSGHAGMDHSAQAGAAQDHSMHQGHVGHGPMNQGDHAGHAGMDHGAQAGAAQDHSMHQGHVGHGPTTVPADGAMLMGPPASFSITFPHAMRLTGVSVQAHGQAAVVVAVAEAPAGTSATVALPTLAPATYTLTWTAQGEDDHQMTGTVGFMVH